MSLCLGIIGTAGRGADAQGLTSSHYRMMCIIAQTVAEVVGADHLVSGGSAWADHCAVQLFLDGAVKGLTLHLAAEFQMDQEAVTWHFDRTKPEGRRLNELHAAFSGPGLDSMCDIARAISNGAIVHVNPGGFHARNADVAKQAGTLLAFTFSGGPLPADGGTNHTWGLFRDKVNAMFAHSREHYEESPCGCISNQPDPVSAYHFDLTNRQLHRHVYEDPAVLEQRAEWAAEDAERRAERPPVVIPPRTPQEEKLDLL